MRKKEEWNVEKIVDEIEEERVGYCKTKTIVLSHYISVLKCFKGVST